MNARGARGWAGRLAAAVLLCGLLSAGALGGPAGPQGRQGRPPAARKPLKMSVELVPVIASVLDDAGRPVVDLPEQDFRILQDGRAQKIELFERQTDLPLNLALMIDTSLSAYSEMKFEREAAARFIEKVLRPGDAIAVFSFAYYVTELSPFTGDAATLDRGLRGLAPGTGTSLYDAVVLGSQALGEEPAGRRRVLLLVTDAGETTSRAGYEQAQEAVLRSGAMLYTILIRAIHSDVGRNTGGEHALETILDAAGGALYPVDSLRQFDSTFDRINGELRTEYLLGYYPNPAPAPGSYHSIELRLSAPGMRYALSYRKGYYAPETRP